MSVNSTDKIATFRADWPDRLNPAFKSTLSKILHIFWNIISIIIFPIGIARFTIQHLKKLAFRIIVPGIPDIDVPITGYWDLIKVALRLIYNPENFKANMAEEGKWMLNAFSGQPIQLEAPDGAKLDGAFFPGKNSQKAIIYAGGNAQQWEALYQMVHILKPLNTSILVLNPRGVGKSEGHRSQEGYALDYYTGYEYLIHEQNIDPENVLAIGFSMGGALTACGASLIQEKYPDKKIKAINLSSFSSLQLEIQELLSRRKGILPLLGRIGAWIIQPEINVKPHWDKLKGEKCIFYNAKDPIIPKAASLYKAVKKNPIAESRAIKMDPLTKHLPFNHRIEMHALHRQILQILKIDLKQTEIDFLPNIPPQLEPKKFVRVEG